MKRLTALLITVFMIAASGQAMARSTKYCLKHFDKSGHFSYTVQTENNAAKHCSTHVAGGKRAGTDVQVEAACCLSNASVSNSNSPDCDHECVSCGPGTLDGC